MTLDVLRSKYGIERGGLLCWAVEGIFIYLFRDLGTNFLGLELHVEYFHELTFMMLITFWSCEFMLESYRTDFPHGYFSCLNYTKGSGCHAQVFVSLVRFRFLFWICNRVIYKGGFIWYLVNCIRDNPCFSLASSIPTAGKGQPHVVLIKQTCHSMCWHDGFATSLWYSTLRLQLLFQSSDSSCSLRASDSSCSSSPVPPAAHRNLLMKTRTLIARWRFSEYDRCFYRF